MIGGLESENGDKRSGALRKLWTEALDPTKKVRDDLDQYGSTVPLGDEDIDWLAKKGLTSTNKHERELAAILLEPAHIPLSGDCVATLMKMILDEKEYAPARIHAAVALWTKHINRDQVRPELIKARERRLDGTPEEKDIMDAIATDLLTEEQINPKK